MSTTNTLEKLITIGEVAGLAINAIIASYNHLNENKEKYTDLFQSVLRYMDSMQIPNSPLTGAEKKAAVLAKVKEIAIDLLFNWEKIANIISDLIDTAKATYNSLLANAALIKDKVALIIK